MAIYNRTHNDNTDYYRTPDWAVDKILEVAKLEGVVLEPCCVDYETEFFNGAIWKGISDYRQGEKVLVYDGTGSILEVPSQYIKIKSDEDLYYFEGKKLNMALSKEHRVLFYNRNNMSSLEELPATEVFKKYFSDSNGFRGLIPTSWEDDGYLELDEDLLRLAVACNADGTLRSDKSNIYEIRVKKNRKKDRLLKLLNDANIDYTIGKCYNKIGYLGVRFRSPLGCKKFPLEWLNLTRHLKEVILDEIKYWDGRVSKTGYTEYFSSKKEDVDFIQFIAHSIGRYASIYEDTRQGRLTSYRLILGNHAYYSLPKKGRSWLSVHKSEDGYKYCFTVSTGMLILRRKNKIFITGNCGDGAFSNKIPNCLASDIRTEGIVGRGG